MNRLGTALLAAIEAVVTVGVGVGIALVPLTLLWGFEYGLQIDWAVFWKAAGSVWLLGHGVDVTFVLDAATAKASELSGAAAPIPVTLAALGFAAVTVWLGARAGRRFAETEHRVTGLLVGTAAVAVLGLALALSSSSSASHPVVWQAIVFPALWFGVPATAAAEVCRRRRGLPADPATARVLDQVDRIPAVWRAVAGFGLRAGTAATAAVVAVAGIVVALLLFGSFAEVITLYERSHAEVVGGIALTVGQLAFLPDFVGWATAWLVGPGFAIGTGSSVSPIATTLGPVPGLPVFGALPASGHTFGFAWVLVPVVASFAVAGLLRPRLVRALGAEDSALRRALAGVATGVVAGVLVGFLAWVSSGSFGPGRLADVGPHALVVGAFAALEVGVPAVVALAVGSDLVRLPERGLGGRWHESADDDDDRAAVEAEGSLIAALDRAGAGRTTDVHRFVVEERHDDPTAAAPTETIDDRADRSAAPTPTGIGPRAGTDLHDGGDAPEPGRASRPEPHRDPDADVELPDWARTGEPVARTAAPQAAVPEPPRRGGVAGIRERLRGAADGVLDRAEDLRDRAGALRDRVTGVDAERPGSEQRGDDRPEPPSAPGTEQQPAFPWSTEEFVAGRDDVDAPEPDESASAESASAEPPAAERRQRTWDRTDQIPSDELPWWRQPKRDR